MAKPPKRLSPPQGKAQGEVPAFLKDYDGPTGLENVEFLDRAFWLDPDRHTEPWIKAFEAIDNRRDKGPLLRLLKSDCDLPRNARVCLADLLARHQLKKNRGGQSVPAYDRSDVEAMLELAIMDVRARESGISIKDALEQVSKSRGIPHELLASAYRGNRGSTRRMKKRRP